MMHDGSPSRARIVHVKLLLLLARSGQINPDNQVYTFRLHKNIWFHNGKTMTSAGVLASFERYRRVGLDRSVLSPVAHWDVPDETTFVITLKEPFPTFLESMSSIAVPIAIIPAEHADAPAQQLPPVGTGPFRVEKFAAGSHLRLRRFEDYVPDTRQAGDADPRRACARLALRPCPNPVSTYRYVQPYITRRADIMGAERSEHNADRRSGER
jgi:peptide/nickel transport system substrate-binding protein